MPFVKYMLSFAFIAMSTLGPSESRANAPASTADHAAITQATVAETIKVISSELRDGYVYPDRGAQAAEALENALLQGAYTNITDRVDFAQKVTEQLRAVTGDNHMRLISGSPFADKSSEPAQPDAGFEVKRLESNIGYLRLARFVPPDVFNPAADRAMQNVADTSALIVDMRGNGGGHPGSVAYLASFFFDATQPAQMSSLVWRNRGEKTFRTETFQTSPTLIHYVGKPVYVLVDEKTYSAAEAFAYDLQVLKRATIVGSKTRGGANAGGLKELRSDLFVVIPIGRAENPMTKGNWNGTGVLPDVLASSEAGEATAIALAGGNATQSAQK